MWRILQKCTLWTCARRSPILRLSPVRAKDGERFKTYLEDTDYMEAIDKGGECIYKAYVSKADKLMNDRLKVVLNEI